MVDPLIFEPLSIALGLRNKEYNKVEDLYDTRIPLHNEDVFEHGLRYKAKVCMGELPQLLYVVAVQGILVT